MEKELGLAKGHISKLDKSVPNSATAQKIADYFQVSVDYILTGKEHENSLFSADNAIIGTKILSDENLMEALKKYYDLSANRQKDIINYINMIYENEKKGK